MCTDIPGAAGDETVMIGRCQMGTKKSLALKDPPSRRSSSSPQRTNDGDRADVRSRGAAGLWVRPIVGS
jgi:hypothetical protein